MNCSQVGSYDQNNIYSTSQSSQLLFRYRATKLFSLSWRAGARGDTVREVCDGSHRIQTSARGITALGILSNWDSERLGYCDSGSLGYCDPERLGYCDTGVWAIVYSGSWSLAAL